MDSQLPLEIFLYLIIYESIYFNITLSLTWLTSTLYAIWVHFVNAELFDMAYSFSPGITLLILNIWENRDSLIKLFEIKNFTECMKCLNLRLKRQQLQTKPKADKTKESSQNEEEPKLGPILNHDGLVEIPVHLIVRDGTNVCFDATVLVALKPDAHLGDLHVESLNASKQPRDVVLQKASYFSNVHKTFILIPNEFDTPLNLRITRDFKLVVQVKGQLAISGRFSPAAISNEQFLDLFPSKVDGPFKKYLRLRVKTSINSLSAQIWREDTGIFNCTPVFIRENLDNLSLLIFGGKGHKKFPKGLRIEVTEDFSIQESFFDSIIEDLRTTEYPENTMGIFYIKFEYWKDNCGNSLQKLPNWWTQNEHIVSVGNFPQMESIVVNEHNKSFQFKVTINSNLANKMIDFKFMKVQRSS